MNDEEKELEWHIVPGGKATRENTTSDDMISSDSLRQPVTGCLEIRQTERPNLALMETTINRDYALWDRKDKMGRRPRSERER